MRFQDVIRFFEAKKINEKCHVCNAETWVIHTFDGDKRLYGMPLVDPMDSYKRFTGLYQTGITVLNVECDNCGCLRTFAAEKIAAWVAENPGNAEVQPAGGAEE